MKVRPELQSKQDILQQLTQPVPRWAPDFRGGNEQATAWNNALETAAQLISGKAKPDFSNLLLERGEEVPEDAAISQPWERSCRWYKKAGIPSSFRVPKNTE